MRKVISGLLLGVIGIFSLKLYAPSLTITQPGFYQLSQPLAASPLSAGDAIILISASNVVLDFHGNPVSQNNNTSSIDGVRVAPGLTDVTIQNGVIRNVTGNGLAITPSNAETQIINVMFENCGATGINADGSAGTINNLGIASCRFIGCGSNSTSTTILSLVNCIDGSINECEIAGSSNSVTTTFAPCSILSSSLMMVNDLRIEDNISTASFFIGFADLGNAACQFNDIMVRKNVDLTGTLNGYLINSAGNIYTNCLCVSNSNGFNGAFYGFQISGTIAQYNIFNGCGAVSNISSATAGFFGFSIERDNNSFFDCYALSNSNFNQGTLGSLCVNSNIYGAVVGFYIPSPIANFTTLTRCIGANNRGDIAGSSSTAGVLIERCGGISSINCAITDGIFFNNLGSTPLSRGIISQTNTFSLFVRNIAYQGSTGSASGPIVGVNGGSITTPAAPATNNINNAIVYWTNLNVIA